jgi:hypothetical protein
MAFVTFLGFLALSGDCIRVLKAFPSNGAVKAEGKALLPAQPLPVLVQQLCLDVICVLDCLTATAADAKQQQQHKGYCRAQRMQPSKLQGTGACACHECVSETDSDSSAGSEGERLRSQYSFRAFSRSMTNALNTERLAGGRKRFVCVNKG